jgi:hypothetical protein
MRFLKPSTTAIQPAGFMPTWKKTTMAHCLSGEAKLSNPQIHSVIATFNIKNIFLTVDEIPEA